LRLFVIALNQGMAGCYELDLGVLCDIAEATSYQESSTGRLVIAGLETRYAIEQDASKMFIRSGWHICTTGRTCGKCSLWRDQTTLVCCHTGETSISKGHDGGLALSRQCKRQPSKKRTQWSLSPCEGTIVVKQIFLNSRETGSIYSVESGKLPAAA